MKLRIGKLPYLNNLPFYYDWPGRYPKLMAECTFVEGPPRFLNEKMQQGEIDVSVVSSIEYARHFDKYFILPEISISANGRVQSVLLFSRMPIDRLDGQRVFISSDSETSAGLIKIILSHYGQRPVYIPFSSSGDDNYTPTGFLRAGSEEAPTAILLIGDRALEIKEKIKDDKEIFLYDLAEEWYKITGLPFVFALWVVRQDALAKDMKTVFKVWYALRESYGYSLNNLEKLIGSTSCKELNNISYSVIFKYLKSLEYHLSPSCLEGLKLYYRFLFEMGELSCPVSGFRFLREVEW